MKKINDKTFSSAEKVISPIPREQLIALRNHLHLMDPCQMGQCSGRLLFDSGVERRLSEGEFLPHSLNFGSGDSFHTPGEEF